MANLTAESSGFAWWSGVGDWRGFVLVRNWVNRLLHWRAGCARLQDLLFSICVLDAFWTFPVRKRENHLELILAQTQALGVEPLWAEVTTNQACEISVFGTGARPPYLLPFPAGTMIFIM